MKSMTPVISTSSPGLAAQTKDNTNFATVANAKTVPSRSNLRTVLPALISRQSAEALDENISKN
jgi:hypothetical protein